MDTIINNSITFPCNEKIPIVQKWTELTQKINHEKNSNYAILTGKINNLTIIDCDVLKNDNPNKFTCGVEFWNDLKKENTFLNNLETPIIRTQSGGLHIYFQYTDELQSGVQKIKDLNGKIVKIDILSDKKCVIGPGSIGYSFIYNSQYYTPKRFPSFLIDIFKPISKIITFKKENNNEYDDTNISKQELENIVNGIPDNYSENYETWIKIIWAIAETAKRNYLDGLSIADEFSRRSNKYKSIEDVEKIYNQNKGDITIGTLIYLSSYTFHKENNELLKNTNKENLLKDINILLPENIKSVLSIKDNELYKICDLITDENKKISIKIFKDNFITTKDDNSFIGYLQSILNIKYDLSVIHSEFKNDCEVIFIDKNTIDFVSKEETKGEHRIRIKHPWDNKKRYFTKYSNGKQLGTMRRNKQELSVMIEEALKNACHFTLKNRYNLTINIQGDINIYNGVTEDKIRSEEQIIQDLISSHPGILNCFKYSDSNGLFKGLFLYGPNTGIWRRENNGVLEKMLSSRIKKFVPYLSKEEIKYIETNKNIQQLRMMFIKEIDDKDFENQVDENRNVFSMTNCIYDISNNEFRRATPLDFIYTNCGWDYNEELANKYLPDIENFFKKLFPIKEEHDVAVSFFSSLLHGYRLDKKFVALTDKRNGNNGKSTLISLLRRFFGDYTKTSNKFLLKGSFDKDKDSHDGGLEPLKGKRILVCDELKKNMRLDEGLIKNLAGGEYIVEGRRLGKSDQFRFMWQTGIVMIFNEGDCPKFDCTDNAFMERMIIIPMRSKFVVDETNENTFTFKRDADITSKFDLWRSSLLKFFLKYIRKDGLTNIKIPLSMREWKDEILNENNELKDWLFSIIEEDKNGFVGLGDLRDRFKLTFPHERNLKSKDIERMINSLFNNKGIYLKEQHQFRENGKKICFRNVYLSYKIKDYIT